MHPNSRLSSICLRMLDENLAALETSSEGLKNEEVVHELRVTTKQLRAAWKMAGAALSPGFASSQRDRLRELSALLAEDRDHAVLVNLASELHDRHPEAGFSVAVQFLNDNADESETADTTATIKSLIEQEKSAWEQVTFSTVAAEQRCLRNAVQKSRIQARLATKVALKDGDPEVWHTWRKKVKQLRYQREFLAETQNRIPGKFDARISRLGSGLGDRNDLANLTDLAVKMGNPPLIRKAIATEERQILGSCRRLGRRNLISR